MNKEIPQQVKNDIQKLFVSAIKKKHTNSILLNSECIEADDESVINKMKCDKENIEFSKEVFGLCKEKNIKVRIYQDDDYVCYQFKR